MNEKNQPQKKKKKVYFKRKKYMRPGTKFTLFALAIMILFYFTVFIVWGCGN